MDGEDDITRAFIVVGNDVGDERADVEPVGTPAEPGNRAAGIPRTACGTTLDDFVREFAAAQQAKQLTTLVAKVDAVGPAAFVTDLGLLENRFQFQRYLQAR